jgi:hypothetical protein
VAVEVAARTSIVVLLELTKERLKGYNTKIINIELL